MEKTQQTRAIAQTLTYEVMDENNRGTQRITKHGEPRKSNKHVWESIPKFIGKIFKRYIDYYGKKD